MAEQRWGASPQDWMHFDLVLGLTEDVLPVVSNPNGEISQASKMKDIGKTPSLYNNARKVVGIKDWTAKNATPAEIERWSKESDYGICVQTRRVRALDIDVADPVEAAEISEAIRLLVGCDLPTRRRLNSGKCLHAFRVDATLSKRSFRTANGLVEFLANGQQFIAIGTHPTGARYEWEGGLPDAIPALTGAEFEALWAALAARFAVGASTQKDTVTRRPMDASIAKQDSLYEWLANQGLVLDYGNEGQAFIECPWKDAHSGDSGVTETAYFPRGGRGYELGHFKCFHASCQGHSDADFEDALGYRDALIEDLPALIDAGGVEKLPTPLMERDKNGRIKATLPNLRAALSRPDCFDWRVRFDTFFNNIMVARVDDTEWAQITDDTEALIRSEFERQFGFLPIGKDIMRDALRLAGRDNKFDTAQSWLNSLEWDGVRRIDTFFVRFFGVEDSAYARAVGRYIWTAMAGRVLTPGVKADMVPVLVGPQGAGKSSGVRAMVPDDAFFTEINIAERDADLSRVMRGKLIGEIGELRGFRRVEQEAIKAFISRTHEEWVEKYEARATVMPRRLMFLGTTNINEFLEDDTGNRRWLPLVVGTVDVAGVRKTAAQLWAEAREAYGVLGVDWTAERLAAKAHADHAVRDTWEEVIGSWLDTPSEVDGSSPGVGVVKSSDALIFALGFDPKQIKRSDEMRVAAVLKALGMKQMVRWEDGRTVRGWVRKATC